MTPALPPLDMHAHVHPDISAADLEALGAVIFAVTRSHAESEIALARSDRAAIWGAGVHPGLVGASKAYREGTFRRLIDSTPFVGEVGLDALGRADEQLQWANLRSILAVTKQVPRIVSLHSYGATGSILQALDENPNRGAVLHWWLGNADETARAVAAGCYFSLNASNIRDTWRLRAIPLERLLCETDHPAGNRWDGRDARPGNVGAVEATIGRVYGLSLAAVRTQMWVNFDRLVEQSKTRELMPLLVKAILRSLQH